MNSKYALTIRRWVPFLLLLFSIAVVAPDAAAQSRGRGGTTREKNGRVERTEKKSRTRSEDRKTGRASRSAGKTETSRSRTQSRTREAQTSRQRETPRRGAQTTPPRKVERTRQPDVARGQKTETRSRGTRTERTTPQTRSGRETRRVEPPQNAPAGRGTTRSRSDDRQQQTRTRSSNQDRSSRTSRDRGQRNRRDDATTRRSSREQAGTTGRRVDRNGSRRDDDGRNRRTRYVERNNWYTHYQRDHRYQRKHWQRRYTNKRRYYNRPFIFRPFIHIDVRWPWVHRYHHGWRPRYQYRQVIYVDAGWGHSHRRSQIDVRTYYYHELRAATEDRAEVDIYVERVELYQDGRYIGDVRDIPEYLGHMRATVYRNGDIRFDRNVFVVGDWQSGFELISTRYYDGFLLDSYRPRDGMRVGVVDLQRGRVVPASHSYLFDPYNFSGYVPVSLLPDDTSWLLDYGNASFSAAYYDSDPYYYGGYNGYGNEYDNDYYGDDYYEEDYYEDNQGRPYYSVRSTVAEANFNIEPLTQTYNRSYKTSFGANIQLKRETQFVRVK